MHKQIIHENLSQCYCMYTLIPNVSSHVESSIMYTQRKIQRFTHGTCRTFHALQVPRDSRSLPKVPGSATEGLSRGTPSVRVRLCRFIYIAT